MSPFRADLHCHTTCSDGSKSPMELVALAAEVGLQGLAITDHDSIDAYAEAIPVAESSGIRLISGVEFSTHHRGANVHLLAYAFSLQHPTILSLCKRHHERRQERCRRILERLATKGVDLSQDAELSVAIERGSSVGRPHVAAALIRRGIVRSTEAAFRQFLGEGCSCYVSMDHISTEETVAMIHDAGGLAILAHPHLIADARLLQNLFALPLDGIEAYYARFPMDRANAWLAIASKKNWLVTGGSDYHGEAKPQIPLGASWVSQETFRILEDHYQSVQ
jgi:predicted metal-dependent phosphoesterase TrpH